MAPPPMERLILDVYGAGYPGSAQLMAIFNVRALLVVSRNLPFCLDVLLQFGLNDSGKVQLKWQ